MGNNMTTQNTVLETDAGYQLNFPLWQQVRAAIRGKQGAIMLLNTDGYFGIVSPQYRVTSDNYNEVDKRRRSYFARGRFFNATGRTHDAYVGMIGSSKVESELPSQLEGLKDNVDGEDATINDFALEVSSEVLTTARYGILVDPPNLSGGTLAMAQQALPKFVGYKAEQIKRSVVDKGKLVMVELIETYVEKDGDKYETKEQIRRLELIDGMYTSMVKRDGDIVESDFAMVNGSMLDYIPFHFVGAENNKASYDRPVMFDLAHENMGHFQLSCDNLENLHFHGQGMTNVFTNLDEAEIAELNPQGIDVGAKGVNIWAQGDKVEILQIAATGAIPTEMKCVEQRMIMLGAQVVQDTNTNQTLGAKEIDANASVSQLKRIANNVSAAMTQCAKWAAEMVGATGDASITVNDRFVTDNLTFQDVMAMFTLYQGAGATLDELSEVKRKAGWTQKTNEELADGINENDGVGGVSEREAQLQMEIDNLKGQLNGSTE